MLPLVAVVTLTLPGREEFLELRRKDVLRQSYSRIVHVVVCRPGVALGALRNEAISQAIDAGADIIVNADDDDILLPTRVERQVVTLTTGADLCSTSHYYMYDLRGGYGVVTLPLKSVHDACLAYWARVWKERQLDPKRKVSETVRWMNSFGSRVVDMHDTNLFVYVLHGDNFCAKGFLPREGFVDATAKVHALMGEDLGWYLAQRVT